MDEVYVYQHSPDGPKHVMELRHKVVKLTGWYPKGPLKPDSATLDGGERMVRERKKDMIKFVAEQGGIRLCNAEDLILVR